jgi:hypothetical protein
MHAKRTWAAAVAVALAVTVAGAPATAAPQGGSPEHVTAVEALPDGSTRVTFWEPAPGVTAQQLHRRLQARRVQGLQNPLAALAAAPATCALGTARTAFCPQVRWATNGHEDPQVYFVDHTTAAWPVSAAVPVWNQAQNVDSYYRWNTCPTLAGVHCVHVNSANYGDTEWLGETSIRFDAARNLIDGQVEVRFNNFHTTTAARKRKTVCHELGHALGLGHSTSALSCMVSGAATPATPHADDYALLADIYR